MEILNMSKNPLRYVIYMEMDGGLWYYGSDNDEQRAYQVAAKVSHERDVVVRVLDTKES